jgi:hypothetical protein
MQNSIVNVISINLELILESIFWMSPIFGTMCFMQNLII